MVTGGTFERRIRKGSRALGVPALAVALVVACGGSSSTRSGGGDGKGGETPGAGGATAGTGGTAGTGAAASGAGGRGGSGATSGTSGAGEGGVDGGASGEPQGGAGDDGGTCARGRTRCAGACVDTNVDVLNCGACDNRCNSSQGVPWCINGGCIPDGCPVNAGDCDSTILGCETDLTTFDNCGRCGGSCATAHATAACVDDPMRGRMCVSECHAGFGNCNAANPDCETKLDTAEHCGACRRACTGSTTLCEDGTCVAACASPTATVCGTTCAELSTDESHCGACNRPCESYQACESGRCTPRYLGTGVIARSDYAIVNVAMHTDGSFALVGPLVGSADLDPGVGSDVRTSTGSVDTVVSRFAANGGYSWSRVFGGEGADTPGSVAIGADGSIVVTFNYQQDIDLDPGAGVDSRTTNGEEEHAVVKLSADGSYLWGRTFAVTGSTSRSERGAVAVDASGGVYLFGLFSGEIDLDPGAGASTRTASESLPYLVKLTSAGILAWAVTFPDCSPYISDLELDAGGALWAVGSYGASGDLDPGAGVILTTLMGESDSFQLFFDAQTGTVLGGEGFSMASNDALSTIVFDPDGSRYVGGTYYSAGYRPNGFLFRIEPGDLSGWQRTLDGVSGFGLAPVPGGGVIAVGMGVHGPGPTSEGIFMMKVDRSNEIAWSIELAGSGSSPHGIGANAQGFVAVGNVDTDPIDFDPSTAMEIVTTPGTFITRYGF